MENTLNLKAPCTFIEGTTESICLRGARRFELGKDNLTIYSGDSCVKATVVSCQQFRFKDLDVFDVMDNYNIGCRTKEDLFWEMEELYDGFNKREIVTILRFEL